MKPKPRERRDPGQVAGKRFGKFTVLKEIGRGGMGIVYLAVDPRLRRQVALKILIGGEGVTELSIKRFLREARSMSHLRHPHIVPVHEAGTVGKTHYFTMDVIQGKELGDIAPLMSLRERLKIMYKVCKALEFAHAEGIVHRDLKPGNIMVDVHHNPYVMDFGLAKDLSSQSMQSVTGTVLGTPSYMSPEQAQGLVHDIDHRSDIYTVGAILYEMVTGRVAFQGSTMFDTLFAVVNKSHLPLRSVAPDVDEALVTIVDRCLEKKPEERYQRMVDLGQDLYDYLRGGRVAARGIAAHRRGWRWLQEHTAIKLCALAAVPALLVLVAMLILFSGDPVLEQVDRAVASGDGPRIVNALRLVRDKVSHEAAYRQGAGRARVLDHVYAVLSGEEAEAAAIAFEVLEKLGGAGTPERLLALVEAGGLPEPRLRRALKTVRVLAMNGYRPDAARIEGLGRLLDDRARPSGLRVELIATLAKVIEQRRELFAHLRPVAGFPDEHPDVRFAAIREIGRRLRLQDGKEMFVMMRCAAAADRNVRHAAEEALDQARDRPSVFAAYGLGGKANAAYSGAAGVHQLNAERMRKMEGIADGMDHPERAGEKPDEKPARVIARKLQDEDVLTRMLACRDLGDHGDAMAVDQLVNRIRLDGSNDVKRAAAQAVVELAAKRHPVPYPKLIELVGFEDAGARANAAWVLGRLEYGPAGAALVDRLGGEDQVFVRERLIEALGRIGDPARLPGMRAWFDAHRDDEAARSMLRAWAMHKAFGAAAYPHLVAALEAESPSLRTAARETLAGLTGHDWDDPARWRRWLAGSPKGE